MRAIRTSEMFSGALIVGSVLKDPFDADPEISAEHKLSETAIDQLAKCWGHEKRDILDTYHAALARNIVRKAGWQLKRMGVMYQHEDAQDNRTMIWVCEPI